MKEMNGNEMKEMKGNEKNAGNSIEKCSDFWNQNILFLELDFMIVGALHACLCFLVLCEWEAREIRKPYEYS